MKRKSKLFPRWNLIVVVLLLIVFIAPATFDLLREKWLISSAISRAKSVRIEQYRDWLDMGGKPEQVIAAKQLDPAEFSKVSSAFPVFLDAGIPGMDTLCIFNPHHRIIITDQEGHQTVVRVCFECDHIQIETNQDKGGATYQLWRTPLPWQHSLRKYFASLGMSEPPDGYRLRSNPAPPAKE